MRIIAGKYGGRRLKTPQNKDIRPTTDKVRGAVFNALESKGVVDSSRVVDLFCGTGGLGLEALSRGAAHCVFVDSAHESLQLAQENARTFGVPEAQTQFIRCKAQNLPILDKNTQKATLIFCDPPYGQNLIVPALNHLVDGGWFAENAFVVLETDKREDIDLPHNFIPVFERLYGDTKIVFVQYKMH